MVDRHRSRRTRDARSEVALLRLRTPDVAERVLFTGPGALGVSAWSPDGRWLLVAWPAATGRPDARGR